MDVVVEGRALLDEGLVDCSIGIEDGRIAKIAKSIGRADRRYDLSGMLILPCGVDLHVHFRDPGLTAKEDFSTGSMAAAAGGVTYVMDMPNTLPPTRTLSDIEEKIGIASRKSFVDFGMAVLLDERTDVERTSEKAAAFKIYLGETTGDLGADPGSVGALLERASGRGRPVAAHAEHVRPLSSGVDRNLVEHDMRRSEELEREAAKMMCDLGRTAGRAHLLHVTQASVLQLARGAGLTAEVTPHHLLLDTGMKLGSWGKVNPPLRSRSTRSRLWEAFAAGQADAMGSDHSPHTIDEKEEEFEEAPSGVPGVETMLPMMLQMVAKGRLELSLMVRMCCRRPADLVSVRKGRIQIGYDADLMAVDIRRSVKIRADRLHSKCGWTPFEGLDAVFPELVMLRGQELARSGDITGERLGRLAPLAEGPA